jgi:hypothetical protein
VQVLEAVPDVQVLDTVCALTETPDVVVVGVTVTEVAVAPVVTLKVWVIGIATTSMVVD